MKIMNILSSIFDRQDKFSQIKKIDLFKGLNIYELKLVDNVLNERTYTSGEYLYKESYPHEAIYLIIEGEVELIGPTQPGGVRIMGNGKALGLIDMYNEQMRSSSARALKSTRAYAISRADFYELLNKNPSLGVKVLTAICKAMSEFVYGFIEQG